VAGRVLKASSPDDPADQASPSGPSTSAAEPAASEDRS
jgi:hypothetical protein